MPAEENSKSRFRPAVRDLPASLSLVLLLVLVAFASWTVTPFWIVRHHAASLLWWVFLASAAHLQGKALFSLMQPEGLDLGPGFDAVIAFGLGLGLLSIEAFAAGIAGFFTTPSLTALLVAALALPILLRRGVRFAALPGWPTLPDRSALAPLGMAVLAALLTLLFALSPPVFFDAMTYHLELPARYLQAGRIFHVPENLYSGYPQLIEVLFGMGLALSDIALAGLISMTAMAATLVLTWTWARRRFTDEGAGWGIAMLALTPPFMVMAGFFQNDWITAFYTLAAVFLLEGGARDPRRMILAGAMAGLAAGCKYTALAFALAAPLGAGLVDDLFHRRGFRVRSWGFYLAAAAAAASPWYLKNLLLTGDPLYPLLAGLAGKVEGLRLLAADTHFSQLGPADLWKWATVPFAAVFKPEEIQLALSAGFLPLVLLPTLFCLRGSRTGSLYLGAWAALSFFAWYVSFRAGRFLLPVAALAFLYLGAGLARAAGSSARLGKILPGAVILVLLGNAGSFIGYQARYMNTVKASLGTMDPETFLLANYSPYPAIKFLNEMQPPAGKVLFLGEMKAFYSQFPREVPTFEVPNRLLEMVRRGLPPDGIASELAEAGFTHILFHPAEMARLAVKSPFLRLDDKEREALGLFLEREARLVFKEKGIYVFEVRRG